MTKQGRTLVHKAQTQVWPVIDEALASTCASLQGSLLEQLAGLEAQLGQRSLEARALQLLTAPRDTVDLRRPDQVEGWMAAAKPQAVFLAAARVCGIYANDTRPANQQH